MKMTDSQRAAKEFMEACALEVGLSMRGGWDGAALPYGIRASWRRFASALRQSRRPAPKRSASKTASQANGKGAA
jgi:hypothetical protein